MRNFPDGKRIFEAMYTKDSSTSKTIQDTKTQVRGHHSDGREISKALIISGTYI